MKRFAWLVVCILSVFAGFSQTISEVVGISSRKRELLNDKSGWSEGSIMLADDTELKGLVKYNDRNGVLSFHDGENSRAFTPRSVLGFEFFDEGMQQQRVFYSFPYEDSKDDIKRPLFFEAVKQFKKFAILVKTDPVNVEQKASNSNAGIWYTSGGTRTVVSQVETIYVMGDDGVIHAYFKSTREQDGARSLLRKGEDTKTKKASIDKDLLEDYISANDYEVLQKYARENDLSFKDKVDFIKIMNYYELNLAK
jgi:hypothetical protein